MSVIWAKVWFDLWHMKSRTLLVVLSIAAGVFAIGAMFGMSDQLLSTMDAAHQAVVPAHVKISLDTFIDRDTARFVKNVPGVENAQPFVQMPVRYKVRAEDPWKNGIVYILDNYDNQIYELIQLKEGRWPQRNDIGIERLAAQHLGKEIGNNLIFEINDSERVLPISGKIRHPFVPPPAFLDLLFFFMDSEGAARLNVPQSKFNALLIRVTPYSEERAKEATTLIKERFAKLGIGVVSTQYQDPDKHWGRMFMEAFTVVLQVLAVVSLLMSVILVYNTLSALITQQTNQIGILKALGGGSRTIAKIYLSAVLIYGALALLIAVPSGAFLAFGIAQSFLDLFNIDYKEFRVSDTAILFQIVAALGVPLLAALIPVAQGAAITVRQAIASYGLGGDFGSSRLDRWIEQIGARFLPSHYATALGNLFRRKGRLVLTLFVLVMAGAMFLMVQSLNSSIDATMEKIYAQRRYDITIEFGGNPRIDRAVEIAQSVEGVEKAEVRFTHSANLIVGGKRVKEAGLGGTLQGAPTGSDFFEPFMLAGRWLQPGDDRAIVITKDMAKKGGVDVGDTVTLDLGELGKDDWQIVGLYDPVFAGGFNPDIIYAPLDAVFDSTNRYFRGNVMLVRTRQHDENFVSPINRQIKDLFETRGIKVVLSQTEPENKRTNDFQFGIITSFMLVLAVLIAIVGGIALMGALSISVVERTKEIGVLRAVGARTRTILGMFVMEGVLQGVISWLIAVPFSFLIAQPMASVLGKVMFSADLTFRFNYAAVVVWLVIVLVISTIASVLPARNATRISVRDSLAYA
ncbi:MAG: ABC transporter permease [Chloroflexi bacterium]|nr:ABC transporter permease [Chloroflexota bacterium]